jgi:GrpB-like predicted nucleotidyltransferase (UPF0157 family)
LSTPILLVAYDLTWPDRFQHEAERIRRAIGQRALRIEHVGSTSVPGLPAKPIIDVLLVAADSAKETEYVAALEGASYKLRIRQPGWYEHRMFKGPENDVNLHVFSVGCPEVARMLAFKEWLRANEAYRDCMPDPSER